MASTSHTRIDGGHFGKWTPSHFAERNNPALLRVDRRQETSFRNAGRLSVSDQRFRIIQYDVEATDEDGDALTYSLNGAPDDMAIDAATGDIIWAPNPLDIGASYTVIVTVADGRGIAWENQRSGGGL